MTGRRSHGRLSALNGVVHQGRAERDAKLSYRSAYYGVRDYLDFTDADKERQLEEALMASNPATDLTLGLEVLYRLRVLGQ